MHVGQLTRKFCDATLLGLNIAALPREVCKSPSVGRKRKSLNFKREHSQEQFHVRRLLKVCLCCAPLLIVNDICPHSTLTKYQDSEVEDFRHARFLPMSEVGIFPMTRCCVTDSPSTAHENVDVTFRLQFSEYAPSIRPCLDTSRSEAHRNRQIPP